MGQVSKRLIKKAIENRLYKVFWHSFTGIKTAERARTFFNSFISDVEHIMLAKRLGIALMLAKGYTYQEIEDTLKVSSNTILSVSQRYKYGGKGLDPAIEAIFKKEKTEEFMDGIEELIGGVENVLKYDTYARRKNPAEKYSKKRLNTRRVL